MSLWRKLRIGLSILLLSGLCTALWACGGYGEHESIDTDELARRLAKAATQADTDAKTESLVLALRDRGRVGMDLLLARRDRLSGQLAREPSESIESEVERLDHLIDKVAGQKFASRSRLFWHTSLSDAKREATRTGRPIVSLRMLGRLDEDLSCANSRFFRTTLYPDPTIATQLRDGFVLHWQPVCDVPLVTIDFGNGRVLRQPLMGNSAHLILNPDGQPIDALPGLVSPSSFSQWLSEVTDLATDLAAQDGQAYWQQVASFHRDRAQRRRDQTDLTIGIDQSVSQLNPLDARWRIHAEQNHVARLTATSRELLSKLTPAGAPDAARAMPIAPTKSLVEAPVLLAVQDVERHIARDTVFNLHALQTKVDDWFAANADGTSASAMSYDELTRQIYSDVFLMPLDDPWLGLSPGDRYTALENGGRMELTAIHGESTR